jgi:phosphate transport system substrate-binding protein
MKKSIVGLVALGLTATFTVAAENIRLAGAGASFPAPIYKKWVAEYQKANPTVQIDYQSIGSGGGIKAITDKTVAFGATDAPLNKKEIEAMGGESKVIQFPTVGGAVVPAYNVPGLKGDLKFTGEVLADIYLGKISKWNDAKIAALNPDQKLPDLAITPAYRTDGSGTTFVWTNYLATQSEAYKTAIGAGKQVKWPVGQGGKGNEGVAAVVQQTAGAIGYVEFNYAVQNKLANGLVRNAAGKFVKCSAAAVSAAGEGAVSQLKGNILAADIWNQPGDASFPIAAFTYIVVHSDLASVKSADEAKALIGFLKWTLTDGQKLAGEMDYAPLSPSVATKSLDALNSAKFGGK